MARATNHTKAGFTITECLVTAALLSLLIAVALPALKGIRRQSVGITGASAMRQMSIAALGYCTENGGRLPFLGVPGNPSMPLISNGFQIPTANGALFFRYQSLYWASLLPGIASMNAEVLPDGPVLMDHGDRFNAPPGKIVATRFNLTSTAFAAPRFWNHAGSSTDLSLIRGTRMSEIRNPSRKGLLLDCFSNHFTSIDPWRTSKVLIGYVDGSIGLEEAEGASRGINGPYLFTTWPIMETVDGLMGIDY